MRWDAIWNRARADLVVSTGKGGQDVVLWEHSNRVARNARRIVQLPMVQEAAPDEAAIVAAAFYHEAGWIVRLEAGETTRERILVRPLPQAHRERGARLMERSLASLLSQESLVRAAEAIRTFQDRKVERIEAQVLAEADNLEEFGLLSLWTSIRRGVVDGKGVQALLDTWHRRKEYRFWEARLTDSFRFPPVRQVAEERIAKLERVMKELEEQHEGADLLAGTAPGRSEQASRPKPR